MPICKQCNQSFSVKIVIEGRLRNLRNRVRCLDCSPFAQYNGRILYPEGKPFKICSSCGKHNNRIYGTGLCNSCHVTEWRRRVKTKCIEKMGGKCQICGYNKCASSLEFHHKNPKEKDFDISGKTIAYNKILKELDKCILVCRNCHGEIHAGVTEIPV